MKSTRFLCLVLMIKYTIIVKQASGDQWTTGEKMTQTKLSQIISENLDFGAKFDLLTPFDPPTIHKIDILIKQLLCQFEGLLVF